MKRWIFRAVCAAVLLALGVWGWRVLFPSPELVIRKRLTDLAQTASFSPGDAPLASLAKQQKLAGFFTPDVEVTIETSGFNQTVRGRDNLMQAVAGAKFAGVGVSVSFPDINVQVAKGTGTAEVYVNARAKVTSEREPYRQEFKINFRKLDSRWLIERIEPSKTFF